MMSRMVSVSHRFVPGLSPGLLMAIVIGGMIGGWSSTATAGLLDKVEQAIQTADLGPAVVGVSIRECPGPELTPGATATELISIRGDEPFIPASNMKLITSGAALIALGPDFTFKTTMWWDADRRTLYIRGDGDPAFGDPELLPMMRNASGTPLDVESFLRIWTRAIEKAGITDIDAIVVDDRIFDRQFVDPQWEQDDLIKHYGAQVSGLTFHTNILHFYPKPIRGGGPDISIMRPNARWIHPRNRASSRTDRESANTVWIARKLGENSFTFFGNVKQAMRMPVRVTVHDMPAFFGKLFANRLRDRGVAVGDSQVVARDAAVEYPRLKQVGPTISTPLSTVLTRCNRDSHNLYAEALLKRTSHHLTNQPGSWKTGGSLLRHIVYKRLNNPAIASSLIVGDGSGLSRDNRVSPELLTAWLASIHADPDPRIRDIYTNSLAVAAKTGTLDDDFRDPRRAPLHGATVQAKSGYISGVSCLSGYVTLTTPGGDQTIAFSILTNNVPQGRIRKAKRLQERIVSHIAAHMAAEADAAQVTLGSD